MAILATGAWTGCLVCGQCGEDCCGVAHADSPIIHALEISAPSVSDIGEKRCVLRSKMRSVPRLASKVGTLQNCQRSTTSELCGVITRGYSSRSNWSPDRLPGWCAKPAITCGSRRLSSSFPWRRVRCSALCGPVNGETGCLRPHGACLTSCKCIAAGIRRARAGLGRSEGQLWSLCFHRVTRW